MDVKLLEVSMLAGEATQEGRREGKVLKHLEAGLRMHSLISMLKTRGVSLSLTIRPVVPEELAQGHTAVEGEPQEAGRTIPIVVRKEAGVVGFIKAVAAVNVEGNDPGETGRRCVIDP
jgi:hypothetical protein